jgi:hypothetical protein
VRLPLPAWLLGLALAACAVPVHPTPLPMPPPPRPLGLDVPRGCEGDLSGSYVYEGDGHWHYLATDDAGVLTLEAFRAEADAGPPAATVVLRRGTQGFKGEVLGKTVLPTGEECDVRLPAEVKACDDGGLLIASAASTAVGEGCQTPSQSRPSVMLEHRLTRADAGER